MRSAWLHFAALGALIFAADHLYSSSAPTTVRPTLVVAAQAADAAAVDAQIDDEVLFREALAREFDRDRAVQARLVRLGRFLGLAADSDDARVEREARALDLQRSDWIVRRHLIELMRIAAAKLQPSDQPDEAALVAYYDRHRARFTQPGRLRFTHVYFSADRRGDRVGGDATDLLAQAEQRRLAPEQAAALGDPFVRGADLTLSEGQLDDVFGPGFAAALAALPERAWSGPVQSTYGAHLIWISERIAGSPVPFDAVRNRVLHELLAERRAAKLRDTVGALRAQYDVRVEPVATTVRSPRRTELGGEHCAEGADG
jgi:hypothetical protein